MDGLKVEPCLATQVTLSRYTPSMLINALWVQSKPGYRLLGWAAKNIPVLAGGSRVVVRISLEPEGPVVSVTVVKLPPLPATASLATIRR